MQPIVGEFGNINWTKLPMFVTSCPRITCRPHNWFTFNTIMSFWSSISLQPPSLTMHWQTHFRLLSQPSSANACYSVADAIFISITSYRATEKLHYTRPLARFPVLYRHNAPTVPCRRSIERLKNRGSEVAIFQMCHWNFHSDGPYIIAIFCADECHWLCCLRWPIAKLRTVTGNKHHDAIMAWRYRNM